MSEVRAWQERVLDSALRRFKRQCAQAGVLAEIRKREHYEKPSTSEEEVGGRSQAQAQIVPTDLIPPGCRTYDLREREILSSFYFRRLKVLVAALASGRVVESGGSGGRRSGGRRLGVLRVLSALAGAIRMAGRGGPGGSGRSPSQDETPLRRIPLALMTLRRSSKPTSATATPTW